MTKHIKRLKSIFSQANRINDSRLFFSLLHEFASYLRHPELQKELDAIREKECSMRSWIDHMPHHPSEDHKKLYFHQYKDISVWYSLNQITVFFERYDFGFHDFLVQDLQRKNIDVSQLILEHSELIKYATTGLCPALFPTIDEYKQYMRRIIDSLEELSDNSSELMISLFAFKPDSNQLLIEKCKPIQFLRGKNASLLISYLHEKQWKKVSWKQVKRDLDFESETIKRTVRQINERIPSSLPNFLTTPDHPSQVEEKIIIVSGSYKLSH